MKSSKISLKSVENRFSQVFDIPLNKIKITDSLLLDLICINNYYSTRSGDSFIFPKERKGLKEEVLNTLVVEKGDRNRVKVRLKKLFSNLT